MATLSPACPECRTALPADPASLTSLTACPGCRTPLRITVFPAFGRGITLGPKAEKLTGDDEAACYFHATKKAVVPCDRCGRFLCALCDLPLAGEHLCPTCLQAAQQGGNTPAPLDRSRVRWDRIVWLTVLLPILLCWMATPVTGFAAAGIAVWRLAAPPSRIVRSRGRLIAGAIAGVLVGVIGLVGLIAVFSHS